MPRLHHVCVLIFIALTAKSVFFEAVNADLVQQAQVSENLLADSQLKSYLLNTPRKTWDGLWKWVFLSSALVINVFIYFDLFIKREERPQNS